MARRIQPERNADGTQKTYQQRQYERRQEANRQQREAQEQRQREAIEARYRPPEPPPPTFSERQAARRAAELGKQLAAERLAALAPVENVNPFRVRAAQLEGQPHLRHRYRAMLAKADEWDREQAAQEATAERQAKIDNDPAVLNARENAGYLIRAVPDDPEFKEEAALCAGLAQAGDVAQYWERVRDLEKRIWQLEERAVAEKLSASTATQAEHLEQAKVAQEARERFENATNMASQAVRD